MTVKTEEQMRRPDQGESDDMLCRAFLSDDSKA